MKKFLLSMLAIICGLWAVDRTGGLAMKWVSEHSNDVLSPKLRYVRDSLHEDIVLMGASRCHHHYVPSIISDSVGMSVYNAGVGSADNIYSHYILLCHILEHHTPKAVCLEVMPTDWCSQSDDFSATALFAPLFGRSRMADSVYRLSDRYWRYKVSYLYRYNAKAPSNLWGLLLNRQKGGDNGYIPLPEPSRLPTEIASELPVCQTDSQKVTYLHRFISLCRQHRIRLIFTVSPKFTKVDSCYYAPLKSLANEQDIPFLDYHTQGLYLDCPGYFKDVSHLCDKVARHFSSVFSVDFKQLVSDL